MEEIRPITYQDKEAYYYYIQEWYENEEKVIPGNTDIVNYNSFNNMVDRLNSSEVDEGFVPTTTLFYFKDSIIIGAVDIRHQLNDKLSNIGGHVGYGVAKSYRGKGYATILLEKALDELKTLNVEVVLMTCNPLNFASQTVMKKCGGYQIESYIKKNGKPVHRYHIPNTK
ncbi:MULTISPECIES: GNAT family N-acetyltransferase [Staphylococcus]|uniref:GNAT family N-acetyltransferase n=1 Tax=Staphylococcus TaxID=1279 RepID=UPI0002432A5D|nr:MULTISPECIES: GNAT family N-acetyltransferase [Staphylococcus]EHM72854.1 acetyltransferase, GNAT family [Staphylococcus epidermidis 14.1.R1.SE]APT17233.1 GNAT family N-acetyltransferase [Staphylococcus epidermidis]EJD91655.1 acetyltransferase, GNAT family [Staphylococcus epidermidis NIHLM057]EJD98555.1 acetyltransferase, GNAT family [Staphylococcus epidermidis NIHLM053]KEI46625.1 acetyltransferase [Staphylococcus epidermidis UC7032]